MDLRPTSLRITSQAAKTFRQLSTKATTKRSKTRTREHPYSSVIAHSFSSKHSMTIGRLSLEEVTSITSNNNKTLARLLTPVNLHTISKRSTITRVHQIKTCRRMDLTSPVVVNAHLVRQCKWVANRGSLPLLNASRSTLRLQGLDLVQLTTARPCQEAVLMAMTRSRFSRSMRGFTALPRENLISAVLLGGPASATKKRRWSSVVNQTMRRSSWSSYRAPSPTSSKPCIRMRGSLPRTTTRPHAPKSIISSTMSLRLVLQARLTRWRTRWALTATAWRYKLSQSAKMSSILVTRASQLEMKTASLLASRSWNPSPWKRIRR